MNSGVKYCYQQIHIDAARNSTDDFNPFHEPRKQALIRGNPYPDSIVMGFQLECLIEYLISQHRDAHGENRFLSTADLGFSNYQLTFAGALLPGEPFDIDLRPSQRKTDPACLSNRIAVRKEDGFVLMGYKRETTDPLFVPRADFSGLADLGRAPDRAYLPATRYFMKRKFLNTGNAKNFIAGSLADQGYYFDELNDRIHFPDMFPCSLTSCALLEKAMNERHDFMANPVVYSAHNFTVDRKLARKLRSNDVLHILVEGPLPITSEKGLGGSRLAQQLYRCFGLVYGHCILYRAEIYMVPLEVIVAARRPGA
jgi:hypothetical protein